MPRTPKPQRTDLIAKLPVKTGPSDQYGQATQLQQAQKAVPMGNPPGQVAASAPAPAPGPPMPAPQGGPPQAAPPGPNDILPGTLTPLHAPSQLPNQPVTTGIASGPGPGPEALQQGPIAPQSMPVAALISRLASQTGNPEIARLAQMASNQGG